MKKILFLYNSSYTYINTVFEHLNLFQKFSENHFSYLHSTKNEVLSAELSNFDALFWHYSIRLPYDEIEEDTAEKISRYQGLKVLFIQDEYDHTHHAWYWIKRLKFNLVFTVVPEKGIEKVYPRSEFPNVRFVNNITGYAPCASTSFFDIEPPSKRTIMFGYRGRLLPIRYGQMGLDKAKIGTMVRKYCQANGIRCDIGITERSRLYGDAWHQFMQSCRATLGTESGSNVFDWDGNLDAKIKIYRRRKPWASKKNINETIIRPLEKPGLMNQISPRIFEAISMRSCLVLFEGKYSGVVTPEKHFIPLNHDGSNLEKIAALVADDDFIDAMTDRAYKDIIHSGKHSHKAFVRKIDAELRRAFKQRNVKPGNMLKIGSEYDRNESDQITAVPIKSSPGKVRIWPVAAFHRIITGLVKKFNKN